MALFKNDKRNSSGHRLLNNRFTIDLPPEWTDRSIYRFEGPLEDGTLHHITLSIEHGVAMDDVTHYAQSQIKSLETEIQGYHELKRGALTLANRLPAYEVVYKWCPIPEREIYQRMVWALQGCTGYLLATTFTKKTWKMMADHVDGIIRSFAVAEDPAR